MDLRMRVRTRKPYRLRPYGKLILTNAIFLSGRGGTVMCAVDDFHFPLLNIDIGKTQYSLNTAIEKANRIQFYVIGEDAVVNLYGFLHPFGTNSDLFTNIHYHLDRCDSYLSAKQEDDGDEDDDD